jgi:hypothetical protein
LGNPARFWRFFGTKSVKRTKLWGRWRKKTRRNVLPAFMEARHFLFGGQVMYNGGETFLFGGNNRYMATPLWLKMTLFRETTVLPKK